MNNFVNLPPNWTKDTNFWDFNGQLAIIYPFSKIHKLDNGGELSSKLMTIVFFMCDPDEEKNRFYRIPEEERREAIQESFYDAIDWNDELLVEAIDKYPELCLSAVARSLKDMKDFITRRAVILRKMDYTLDTMKDIDAAIAKNDKIYSDFERIEQKYISSEKVGRVRGGRKETPVEKGDL